MRGKDDRPCAYDHTDRITPAYAGKRVDLANTGKCPRDHPRVCGEKFRGARFRDRRMGSPPRMRGKAPLHHVYTDRHRDHPRVCGEKSPFSLFRPPHLGSPPRMRGKGISCCCRKRPGGITPAYAGKSSQTAEHPSIMQDHPRVCGEKSSPTSSHRKGQGSPPRMRGKALAPAPTIDIIGITPAYAGKRK